VIRGHWGVENSSHHIRDVTFAEDASTIYTGTAPRAMATFRTLAIGSLKALGADNIAETTRAIRQAGCIKADVVLQASECRACGEVAAMLDSLVLEGGGTVFVGSRISPPPPTRTTAAAWCLSTRPPPAGASATALAPARPNEAGGSRSADHIGLVQLRRPYCPPWSSR
jgi:hypothetical protein